jgi:hypothetical protein
MGRRDPCLVREFDAKSVLETIQREKVALTNLIEMLDLNIVKLPGGPIWKTGDRRLNELTTTIRLNVSVAWPLFWTATSMFVPGNSAGIEVLELTPVTAISLVPTKTWVLKVLSVRSTSPITAVAVAVRMYSPIPIDVVSQMKLRIWLLPPARL